MSVILNADDEENDVFFLQRALSAAGIRNPLEAVQNGQQAIAYLNGEEPYADRAAFPLPFWIFLDLRLPEVRGVDLVKWIRAQPRFDTTFLVILSGSEMAQEIQEAFQHGANAYLLKPPTPEKILELVRQYDQFVRERGIRPPLQLESL